MREDAHDGRCVLVSSAGLVNDEVYAELADAVEDAEHYVHDPDDPIDIHLLGEKVGTVSFEPVFRRPDGSTR